MSLESGTSICEHEWEEHYDPAAYNDGFYSLVGVSCRKCGAQQDIRRYVGSKKTEWNKILLFIAVFPLIILYLVIAPFIMLVGAIKDEFFSKGKAS